MVRNALFLNAALSLALLGACQAATETPAAAPQPEPVAAPQPAPAGAPGAMSVRDGVYTAAQAERGAEIFSVSCDACHNPDEWTDGAFLRRWNGETGHRFFSWLFQNMPQNNPGSLTDQQYADVMTYIFSLNGLPAGQTELPPAYETLQALQLDWVGDR